LSNKPLWKNFNDNNEDIPKYITFIGQHMRDKKITIQELTGVFDCGRNYVGKMLNNKKKITLNDYEKFRVALQLNNVEAKELRSLVFPWEREREEILDKGLGYVQTNIMLDKKGLPLIGEL